MITDSPWKEAVEVYFRDFMAFLFPNIHDEIDWGKGYDFMDKEPDMLTKKLVGQRMKGGDTKRVDISRKYFSKILKK